MSVAKLDLAKVERELDHYAGHLNMVLKDDEILSHLLPLNEDSKGEDLCRKLQDGLLLARFCNQIPGCEKCIDMNDLNVRKRKKKLNQFQCVENNMVVLKTIDRLHLVKYLDVLPSDMAAAGIRKPKILGLLRQLIDVTSIQITCEY